MAEDRLSSSLYQFDHLLVENIDGDSIDIKNLVVSFEITESINMTFAIYEFVIVDAVAFLEKHGIVGNEKVKLKITWDNFTLEKDLIVAGFKEYGRNGNNSASSYKLRCVSQTALKSKVLRVNKEVTGDIATILSDLYSDIQTGSSFLAVGDNSTEGDHRIIIPNMTYEDAFKMLISRAQNTVGSPFYFFETFWSGQSLSSWQYMIETSPTFKAFLNNTFEDDDNKKDSTRVKISNVKSSLDMSQYTKFTKGGYVSRVHSVDFATKTYTHESYNLLDERLPKLEKDYGLSPNYNLGGTSLEEIDEANTFLIYKNSLAFEDNKVNLSDLMDKNVHRRRMVYQNQNFISHTFDINGDSTLYAGNTIDITLPASTDLERLDTKEDTLMSGKYVISQVTHKFSTDNNYHCTVSVKKDSTDRNLNMKKYRNL